MRCALVALALLLSGCSTKPPPAHARYAAPVVAPPRVETPFAYVEPGDECPNGQCFDIPLGGSR